MPDDPCLEPRRRLVCLSCGHRANVEQSLSVQHCGQPMRDALDVFAGELRKAVDRLMAHRALDDDQHVGLDGSLTDLVYSVDAATRDVEDAVKLGGHWFGGDDE